jgi:hypothetical protein
MQTIVLKEKRMIAVYAGMKNLNAPGMMNALGI